MRSSLTIGVLALALCGCSPAAHIAVTVRSGSDISFNVTTEKDDPGCIEHLAIRDSGGVMRWEITRLAGNTTCLREIAFPKLPAGFASQKSASALASGVYQVEAKSGIYQGVARFTVE